jgi:hypothetical protein
MHRINLRGPWHLAAVEGRLETSRKFHAPPGFVGDSQRQETDRAACKTSESLTFHWQSTSDWPIDSIRCNHSTIFGEASGEISNAASEQDREIFVWDAAKGVGQTKLNGILRPLNEIVLVWQRWPSEWESLIGRYTPQLSHPIHFDSWLEIQI